MKSPIRHVGSITFPPFRNIRVLMMPFYLHDGENSLPSCLNHWKQTINDLVDFQSIKFGIGYLTIDELKLKRGDTHRRPGLHVDGWISEDGFDSGGWGGGGGYASPNQEFGMILAASHFGSQGWNQEFHGQPKEYGDCQHLKDQCKPNCKVDFQANQAYLLGPHTVHKCIPVQQDYHRQFIRISMPSKSNWNNSNTPNPLGILPEGKIVGRRPEHFTNYGMSL